jgi:hypothetical protein
MEKVRASWTRLRGSDSYSALLWGTMATSICTLLFYLLQIVKDESYVLPDMVALKEAFFPGKEKDENAAPKARFLMSFSESVESFLFGMGRIFPCIIVLTLAWASGSIMVAVGADRLFSSWIVGGSSSDLVFCHFILHGACHRNELEHNVHSLPFDFGSYVPGVQWR